MIITLRIYHICYCLSVVKENLRSYLRDAIGMDMRHRSILIEHIFGETGLVSCSEVVSFDESTAKLLTDVLIDEDAKVQEYIKNRLQ